MTDLLEHAIRRLRSLHPEEQDEVARVMLSLAGDEEPVYRLTAEEEAAVLRSRESAVRGEFATDEQMRAIWAKHGA